MPEFLGIAALELVVTDYKFIRGLRDAERAIDKFGGIWTKVGVGAGAALLAIGGAATSMAMKLETQFTLIQNLTENTKQDIDKFRDAIFDMSKALGKSPQELAEGLYAIASAGLIGARGLDVLEIAAKASAIGLGNVATIGRLVTAAMVAYGEENLSAARATEIMAQAINFGALETDSLAGVMGRVLGPASKLGIAFEDVSAFIATYSRLGGTASEATVSMTAIMQTLIKPSKEAADTLADLGISMSEIRRIIREEGLAQGLQFLVEQFEGNDEALAKVIPNIRALRGVLGVTGEQMEEFIKIQSEIRKETNLVGESFTVLQDTTQYKLTKAFNDVKTAMTQLGSTGLPIVSKMAEGVSLLATNADKLSFMPSLLKSIATAWLLLQGAGLAVLAIKIAPWFATFGVQALTLTKGTNMLYTAVVALRGAFIALFTTPAGWLAIAVAGFVALDMALKKYAGGGLISILTGALQKQKDEARGAAAALEIYNKTLEETGDQLDRVTAAVTAIIGVSKTYSNVLDTLNRMQRDGTAITLGALGAMYASDRATREFEGGVKAVVKQLQESNASLIDYEIILLRLPLHLRAVFEEEAGLADLRKDYIPDLRTVSMGVADSTDKQLAHTRALKDAKVAQGEAIGILEMYSAEIDEGKAKVEDYSDSIKRLTGLFADQHPIVAALEAENAILKERIDDIKSSTDDLTPAQEKQIELIEEQIKANGEQISGYKSNQSAVEGQQKALEMLMGEAGYRGLLRSMQDAGVGHEEQIDLMALLSGVYKDLTFGDLPAAINAFEGLKGTLDPAVWAVIAEAIGPALMREIENIADPAEKARIYTLFEQLGFAIPEGVASGVQKAAWKVSQAGLSAINQAFAEMEANLQARSPSKRAAEELGEPISEGIAEGIEDAAPTLFETGVGLISDLIGLMQQEVEDGLPSALHGFVTALEEANLRAEWEAAFGELGADLMMALTDALANPSSSSGAAVYKALEKMLEEANELGLPEAALLGQQIADALAAGLASGSPELIAAALELIGQLGEAIEEASQETAVDAAATFMASFTATMNSNALRDAVGSAGANLIESLRKGIEENDEKALGTAGGVAANIVDEIRKNFDPKEAENFVTLFMAALEDAINTGSAEAMARLQEVLQQIKEAGEKPEKEDTPTTRREAYKGPRGVLVAEAQVGGRLSATDISYIAAIFGVSTDELLNMTRDEVRAAYQSISNPRRLFPSYVTDILGSYKSGIDFVPRDGWAFLHKNERVTPANENTTAGHVFNATIMIGTDVTDPRGTARWLDKYLRAWVDQQFNVERRRYVGRL